MHIRLVRQAKLRTAIAARFLHLRNRHYSLIDLFVFALTPMLALYLRTDTLFGSRLFGEGLAIYTFFAIVIRMVTFYCFGIYRRYWRFVSALDFAHMVLATVVALLITSIGCVVLWTNVPALYLPRSLLLIDAILALLFAGGVRAGARLTEHMRMPSLLPSMNRAEARQRTLIVGAGYTGAQLAREIRTNHNIHLQLIGFVDDDHDKQSMQIHGVSVLGETSQLSALIHIHAIERIIIAMPTATGQVIRQIVASCQQAKVAVQTMPGVDELLNGVVSVSRLRNVQIEDLLRRAPVQTDIAAVGRLLRGKRVLVTGGGGSIGSELCRQILRCQPAQLLLVGHGENSIFTIHQELKRWLEQEMIADPTRHPTILTPLIADLRFGDRIMGIFADHRPQVVFHAAAHKHVPLMEGNPVEAITNNVLGTQLLLKAVQAYHVDRFVMISTDKAVNPTNVMGASKRVAELLVLQAAQQTGNFYQVVRFGNVLGSRGSVIHTFRSQIATGGPVVVTHPDMVRFFMTIPEAVQLVLQAAVLGTGAGVLMLDMGDPVRILDLARDLIELSGLQVGRDIDIAFSGIRPGEKLFEEMFKLDEPHQRTEHDKIFLASNATQALPITLDTLVEPLITAALQNNSDTVISLLTKLLPEYQPWSATKTQEADLSQSLSMASNPLSLKPLLNH